MAGQTCKYIDMLGFEYPGITFDKAMLISNAGDGGVVQVVDTFGITRCARLRDGRFGPWRKMMAEARTDTV